MEELHEHCGLPVVWRGCQPFTGNYDPKRLRVGWTINLTIWLGLAARHGQDDGCQCLSRARCLPHTVEESSGASDAGRTPVL